MYSAGQNKPIWNRDNTGTEPASGLAKNQNQHRIGAHTETYSSHLLKFSYTNAFPNHKYSTVTIYNNLKLKKDND